MIAVFRTGEIGSILRTTIQTISTNRNGTVKIAAKIRKKCASFPPSMKYKAMFVAIRARQYAHRMWVPACKNLRRDRQGGAMREAQPTINRNDKPMNPMPAACAPSKTARMPIPATRDGRLNCVFSAVESFCNILRLRRLMEGFYVTAMNEAGDSELQFILPLPMPVAKERR